MPLLHTHHGQMVSIQQWHKCERNHYVVDVCVQKTMEEDPKMEINVALAWAVNAKNSMQNHLGYSPIQLVFTINYGESTPSLR